MPLMMLLTRHSAASLPMPMMLTDAAIFTPPLREMLRHFATPIKDITLLMLPRYIDADDAMPCCCCRPCCRHAMLPLYFRVAPCALPPAAIAVIDYLPLLR